ncbi:LPD29 domain-containing protein [Burkholderia stagnalis]|uniref:LPD29 domain-containing protein n=1 Tax=Burkholderia stagnalis TaxID=1503054 RepID=UPI0007576369|nr:LPD29 domain-containing protein [Burkholderia stagnalis]KWI32008.1 hypothetical protein WT71_10740 [Burkholderia stagnalis]KWI72803.1 hypothetical protein WT73_11220 [Burkholderia stagnalis]MDY7806073.1 LPD29 domain-containing protein [Burkholderia stagnalis]
MFHNIADHRLNIAEPLYANNRPASTTPAVLADVLTLVGTAQLVQQILREAFPVTAFSISVSENVRGTQLAIRWTDGPRDLQVARFVMPLQATRLSNGGKVERVEHFMLTPAGRQVVTLAADRIALCREFSDGAIERALARLAARYADYLAPDISAFMTLAGYRGGLLQALEIPGVHRTGAHRSGATVQTDVDAMLAESTDARGFPRSTTASRLFVRRDVH